MTVPLELEEDNLEQPIERETPEAMLIKRSNWQLIQNAIEELPLHYREILLFAIWKRCHTATFLKHFRFQ